MASRPGFVWPNRGFVCPGASAGLTKALDVQAEASSDICVGLQNHLLTTNRGHSLGKQELWLPSLGFHLAEQGLLLSRLWRLLVWGYI